MSKVKTIPLKTWQFFNAVKEIFGKSYLTGLFKVSIREKRPDGEVRALLSKAKRELDEDYAFYARNL